VLSHKYTREKKENTQSYRSNHRNANRNERAQELLRGKK
jgi:hypothetical protein